MFAPSLTEQQQTTSYKVVLPFYIYAAFSFLIASFLLFWDISIFRQHHFTPHTLMLTHLMAIGWGTMIILGASHQLIPVLIEGKLYSNRLAYLSFGFTGIGIPFLLYGFSKFDFQLVAQIGACMINVGVLCYVFNVLMSVIKSSKRGIHTWYVLTAAIWLVTTTLFGLLLVYNFTYSILPENSLEYLEVHAHLGIIGWFLMLVIGVGSRLIPMFLISKYNNDLILWAIYILINASLLSFVALKILKVNSFYISGFLILFGVILFGLFCKKAHKARIRKNVDNQMRISLLSVLQMFIPIIALIGAIMIATPEENTPYGMLYGFCVFFGWLTAIILGMTFKTLPFIVWNKVYHLRAYKGKTPAPRELFSEKIFNLMSMAYLLGFLMIIIGFFMTNDWTLKIGTLIMFVTSILYVYNVKLILFHKPKNI